MAEGAERTAYGVKGLVEVGSVVGRFDGKRRGCMLQLVTTLRSRC